MISTRSSRSIPVSLGTKLPSGGTRSTHRVTAPFYPQAAFLVDPGPDIAVFQRRLGQRLQGVQGLNPRARFCSRGRASVSLSSTS